MKKLWNAVLVALTIIALLFLVLSINYLDSWNDSNSIIRVATAGLGLIKFFTPGAEFKKWQHISVICTAVCSVLLYISNKRR